VLFGKRQELILFDKLLSLGFDVYPTLVDDKQIDCVLRKEIDGNPIYLDIQIKSRSKDCNPKNAGTFVPLKVQNPRENFFFIFYSEMAGCYWIVPSIKLVEKANEIKTGNNAEQYRIVFTNLIKNDTVSPRPKFEEFINNFDSLRNFHPEQTERSKIKK
jgi:hypothetical protein